MAININHQTNDISATSGSMTMDGSTPGNPTVSSSAPTAANGKLWIDTNTNILKVYNSGQWSNVAYTGTGNSHSSAANFYSNKAKYNSSANTLENWNTGSTVYQDQTIWVVPAGVKRISVVVVGAGGSAAYLYGGSAGGGSLAYKNYIDVDPGDQWTVQVGAGSSQGSGGGSSFVGTDANGTSISIAAGGGLRANSGSGAGGTYTQAPYGNPTGGGNGGAGGSKSWADGTNGTWAGVGVGGAGGYSGDGGTGGSVSSGSPYPTLGSGTAGSGGGGGGGGAAYDSRNGSGGQRPGGGGGVSLYGLGGNGAGSSGSGGAPGDADPGGLGSNTTDAQTAASLGFVPYHGGAFPSSYFNTSYTDYPNFNWGHPNSTPAGAVRIVWHINSTNSFPSTDVGFKNNDGTLSILETITYVG